MNDWWQHRLLKWGTPHHGGRNSAKRDSGTVYQDEPDQTPRNDAGFKIQDSRFKLESRSAKPESGRRDFRVGRSNACCLFLVLLSWKFTALEVERSV